MTAAEKEQAQQFDRNLTQEDAEREAFRFFADLPWEGQAPDPDTWRADEFLGLL